MPLPEPYLLVIYTVALASFARLITIDTLCDVPRDAFVTTMGNVGAYSRHITAQAATRLDDAPWSLGRLAARLTAIIMAVPRFLAWTLTHWATCPWCIGFWLALLFLWGRPYWEHPVVLFLALAMAMRQAAGLLADR